MRLGCFDECRERRVSKPTPLKLWQALSPFGCNDASPLASFAVQVTLVCFGNGIVCPRKPGIGFFTGGYLVERADDPGGIRWQTGLQPCPLFDLAFITDRDNTLFMDRIEFQRV